MFQGETEKVQLEGILKILRIEAHVQTVILAENFENLTEVSVPHKQISFTFYMECFMAFIFFSLGLPSQHLTHSISSSSKPSNMHHMIPNSSPKCVTHRREINRGNPISDR